MSSILLALLSGMLAAQSPEAAALSETRCDYLLGDGTRVASPGLRVLESTAGAGRFTPALPKGAAIGCGRSSVVPAPQDWKVLEAGHPLYIIEAGPGADQRVGALELSSGQVRYRLLHGKLTPGEAELVSKRLNSFQTSLRK